MAIVIKRFENVSSFKKYIEDTIAETKTLLGTHMGEIEAIRQRYEKTRKRLDLIKKMTGGKQEAAKDTKQTEISGFRVLMNPTAEYELNLMEEAITSLQERLTNFENSREIFPVLSEESMKVGVVLNDGLPTGFLFYVLE